MCRRNRLLGMALLGFGLGMLVAGLFESAFFCGCVGFGAICGGFGMLRKAA